MVSQMVQSDIDLAEAQEAVKIALQSDEQDASAVRAALGRVMGGEASKVAAVNGGRSADQTLDIYHRYDGRHQRVPAYMAPKMLTFRLIADADLYPREIFGMVAWSLKPEELGVLRLEYGPEDFNLGLHCYFSAAQSDERIVADVIGARIPFFCRKRGRDGEAARFSDALTREAHLKKHARATPTLEKYRTERRDREREVSTQDTNAAILELIKQQMSTAAPVVTSQPETASYPCDRCDSTARSAAGLAAHKRSHETGE